MTARFDRLRTEIRKTLVGQSAIVERFLTAILADGHVLIEGVPGLGKTLAVNTLARALSLSFRRIQFTPDLLPADLTGTLIFDPESRRFETRKGPIFAHVILADEINRAPAKVQSALLEAMQERQVTIGGETFALEQPFFVLATQNPIEQEGTYPLPEAQIDRFMLKLKIGYPDTVEELTILRRMTATEPPAEVEPVLAASEILELRAAATAVRLDARIEEYIVTLVDATRCPERHRLDLGPFIQYGASPRATIYLAKAAKAEALLKGRDYALPQDVKCVAMDVLRHRVILNYEAEAQGKTPEQIVARILEAIPVP